MGQTRTTRVAYQGEIMVTEVITCSHCGSDDTVKNGCASKPVSREVPLSCLWASVPRESFSKRLHERAQGGSRNLSREGLNQPLWQQLSRFVHKALSFSGSRQMPLLPEPIPPSLQSEAKKHQSRVKNYPKVFLNRVADPHAPTTHLLSTLSDLVS